MAQQIVSIKALSSRRAIIMAVQKTPSKQPLPEKYRFEGYGAPPRIDIVPGMRTFEDSADAPGWALTAVAAWFFRRANRKPALPLPSSHAIYELKSRDDRTTVGLFSDWGTGYYHSAYIVRHIATLRCAQAVHLGDTYYTGTQAQFDSQVIPLLDPLLRQIPVYMMNANHEMDSNGVAYFKYLAAKRSLASGFAPQPQETSYFCLRNDAHQVVAIDTSYHAKGRYQDPEMRAWLAARLAEGRDRGLVTVLLSQNEPYGPGRDDDVRAGDVRELWDDMKEIVRAGDVAAWFWGDDHYSALYDSTSEFPFAGSCIGHGGYPYEVKHHDATPNDVVPLKWCETGARFPADTGQRQDRGLNGFCVLELSGREVKIRYVDWLLRTRGTAGVRKDEGRFHVHQVEDFTKD